MSQAQNIAAIMEEQSNFAMENNKAANELVKISQELRKLSTDLASDKEGITPKMNEKINKAHKLLDELAKEEIFQSKDKEKCKKAIEDSIGAILDVVHFVEPNGEVIHTTSDSFGNRSYRIWFMEAKKGQVYCTELYFSAVTNNAVVTISRPIYDFEGKITAVLAANVVKD